MNGDEVQEKRDNRFNFAVVVNKNVIRFTLSTGEILDSPVKQAFDDVLVIEINGRRVKLNKSHIVMFEEVS